ncbi:MAG TPA: 50S ribosomal protein L21e [Candidatus Bathyarchaeia archaeon]|jgi:large subunit ribosomal protein L21e|nr:MAG: 50S ribosomal protein L21e [Candidatus Bathyarchaeota archaeon RBG_16_48_13]HJX23525.1 50S ribosomal protein L21e [Candidatus Bathyarchaeia archaeon]
MTKSKGFRSSTRDVLTKRSRSKGMQPLGKLLIEYRPGDRAVISIDPGCQKGMPHKRSHGKIGTILEKRGRAYLLQVTDGDRQKVIISRPEHLKLYTST